MLCIIFFFSSYKNGYGSLHFIGDPSLKCENFVLPINGNEPNSFV